MRSQHSIMILICCHVAHAIYAELSCKGAHG